MLWKRLSAARNGFTKQRKAYFASLEAEREAIRAPEGEARRGGRVPRGLDRLERHLLGLPRPDAAVGRKRPGRARRRGRAVEAVRGRAGQVLLRRPLRGVRREGDRAARARVGEGATARRGAGTAAGDRLARRAVRAARYPGALGAGWLGTAREETRDQLEQGLRRVEETVRRAEETQWKRSNPEALARAEGTVSQLRAAIESLEAQLAKARARGDASGVRKAEEALAARQSWLAEAERTLAGSLSAAELGRRSGDR